ncbi:MAG: hypothetical protein ACRDRA_04635, partial [Pseudonocardiaceae bacterium]
VEQSGVDGRYGALRSRLRKQGEVIGRGSGRGNRLYVRFEGEDRRVSIRPHLVRVVPAVITLPRSVAELEQLRELLPDAGGL